MTDGSVGMLPRINCEVTVIIETFDLSTATGGGVTGVESV